jgi:hypothetical protein
VERKPITKQHSEWFPIDEDSQVGRVKRLLLDEGAVSVEILWRNVHDGELRVIVADEPQAGGWHMSISHMRRAKGGDWVADRYPSWDEIADARYGLLPEDMDMVMHLPPPDQYVALHDTTFHLHEHPPRGPASAWPRQATP